MLYLNSSPQKTESGDPKDNFVKRHPGFLRFSSCWKKTRKWTCTHPGNTQPAVSCSRPVEGQLTTLLSCCDRIRSQVMTALEDTSHSFLSTHHLNPLLLFGERQRPPPSTEAEECQLLTFPASLLQGHKHATQAPPNQRDVSQTLNKALLGGCGRVDHEVFVWRFSVFSSLSFLSLASQRPFLNEGWWFSEASYRTTSSSPRD